MTAQPSLPLASESSEQHKAHGARWLDWLAPFAGKPVVGIELGTWLGESAEWFMEHVLTHPMASLRCVDTFLGSDEHRLAGIDCSTNEAAAWRRLERFKPRVSLHRRRTDEALLDPEFRRAIASFVYVDAAHDAMNVLRDSVLAFDLLQVGGVLIWDDYEWTVMPEEVDRPRIAVDSFLDCYARRLEVIGVGWQVAVRKLS